MTSRHMSKAEFREHAHQIADWIADYWETVQERPVLSRARPGEVLRSLPESAPERGEPWSEIFKDIEAVVMPGITHWQHPAFFAYFSANASAPAVLGDFLCSGLGVQGMLWATSPACTELEQRVIDWLGAAIGLPERFLFRSGGPGGGVIEGTASESTLAAMLAARSRARLGGQDGPLVAYASNQAHSSVMKAAMIAGIASHAQDYEAVRLIDVDDEFRMRPQALEGQVRADMSEGRVPFFVCATVGTTGVTAVDPVAHVAEVIARTGCRAWLHVDAAHCGAACVCPEFAWMLEGVEDADSICFNPHKWLLTNFDCGCLWVADRGPLIGALSITPEYLRNAATESGTVVDYRDWQIPLGRRFRALKLWFVMRHYGLEGLRAHIREHVRLAALLESWVREDPRFEIAAPRTANLVCMRLRAGDDATRALMEAVNKTGRAYVTHTMLPCGAGRFVIRMAVSGTHTGERHVRETWSLLRHLAGAAPA